MLVPAIIYKEDIKQEFLKRIYDLEMCYFMACANYSIQNILYIVNIYLSFVKKIYKIYIFFQNKKRLLKRAARLKHFLNQAFKK